MATKPLVEILALPLIKTTTTTPGKLSPLFFFAKSITPKLPAVPNEQHQQYEREHAQEQQTLSRRIEIKIDGWAEKASSKWEKLSSEPETSFKGRLYKMGNSIMDNIDADEWFLKEIPKQSVNATVVHPQSVDKEVVESRMKEMLASRIPYHLRYRNLSVLCVPLSLAAGLFPGPNVFLAYNLFRLYSHSKALHGAERIQLLLECNELEYRSDEKLDKLLQLTGEDKMAVVPVETLENIGQQLSMPQYFLHDAKRARKQYAKANNIIL